MMRVVRLIAWILLLPFFPLIVAIDMLVIQPMTGTKTSFVDSCRDVFKSWKSCAGLRVCDESL